MAHNCFPFTSAIIKLHAQIPCESRICLTDIGVKNVESLNWLPRGVFVPSGQPHSSLRIEVQFLFRFHWEIKCNRSHVNHVKRFSKIYKFTCRFWATWVLGLHGFGARSTEGG